PTYTKALANLICDMIETDKFGTYHASCEGFCTRYEFVREIMRLAGKAVKVLPAESGEFPTPAKRPHNSRLSKKSLDEAGFERLPDWKISLAEYINSK
ncbi:MAG: sugar nucleotide-binding protein, partial [Clostridia bacterium]|nr:sugar nucleotide-binding protein [Clostridia bacterium]